MANGADAFLLDVRETYEWDIANLAPLGAFLLPMAQVSKRLDEIPRDRPVIVYCRSGVRSMEIARYLVGQGYPDVRNLTGGILAWAQEVDSSL